MTIKDILSRWNQVQCNTISLLLSYINECFLCNFVWRMRWKYSIICDEIKLHKDLRTYNVWHEVHIVHVLFVIMGHMLSNESSSTSNSCFDHYNLQRILRPTERYALVLVMNFCHMYTLQHMHCGVFLHGIRIITMP